MRPWPRRAHRDHPLQRRSPENQLRSLPKFWACRARTWHRQELAAAAAVGAVAAEAAKLWKHRLLTLVLRWKHLPLPAAVRAAAAEAAKLRKQQDQLLTLVAPAVRQWLKPLPAAAGAAAEAAQLQKHQLQQTAVKHLQVLT